MRLRIDSEQFAILPRQKFSLRIGISREENPPRIERFAPEFVEQCALAANRYIIGQKFFANADSAFGQIF